MEGQNKNTISKENKVENKEVEVLQKMKKEFNNEYLKTKDFRIGNEKRNHWATEVFDIVHKGEQLEYESLGEISIPYNDYNTYALDHLPNPPI